MDKKHIRVVAAIIKENEMVFATQRGYGDYKDWWEFPGGKIEEGETPEEALVREIREELGAEIEVDDFLMTVEYDYPKFFLSMDCYWCHIKGGELTLLEHEAAKWLPIDDLRQVNWLPADIEVVEAIEQSRMNGKNIYLAGGCFWGVQKFFDQFEGILETEVGYANGKTENPSYEEVCGGSGHAETLKIVYDAGVIELQKILELYFRIIDPTSLNRQGNDIGVQYRTGIYYTDSEDLPIIEACVARVQEEYETPLAVETAKLETFYPAEEYHQKYLDKNPGGYCHVPRELLNLQKR